MQVGPFIVERNSCEHSILARCMSDEEKRAGSAPTTIFLRMEELKKYIPSGTLTEVSRKICVWWKQHGPACTIERVLTRDESSNENFIWALLLKRLNDGRRNPVDPIV